MDESIKVASVQFDVQSSTSLDRLKEKLENFISTAASYGVELITFPEYFTLPLLYSKKYESFNLEARFEVVANFNKEVHGLVKVLSERYSMTVICGSTPSCKLKAKYNSSYCFVPGEDPVIQPKLHITPFEKETWALSGGPHLKIINSPKAKIAITICYDVEFPGISNFLLENEIEIIAVPYCTDTKHGHHRVNDCAKARAIETQSYVITSGLVGSIENLPEMDIHFAQSSIYTPCDFGFPKDGILNQAEVNSEQLIISELDLRLIRSIRENGSVTPYKDKRADLFPGNNNLI